MSKSKMIQSVEELETQSQGHHIINSLEEGETKKKGSCQ